jgi:hypothetical protein
LPKGAQRLDFFGSEIQLETEVAVSDLDMKTSDELSYALLLMPGRSWIIPLLIREQGLRIHPLFGRGLFQNHEGPGASGLCLYKLDYHKLTREDHSCDGFAAAL